MKLYHLLILIALALLVWLAWTKLPGLRTAVTGAVDEVGGWTEEAREADPVGFLTYAEEKLAADIEAFRESRESLAQTQANAQGEKLRNETLLASADELAGKFRARFQVAELSGQWPVEIGGASYDREELVTQVDSILTERGSYERVIETYTEVITAAEELRDELRTRIQTSEATLVELEAQKELVRVNALTAKTDELLAQVDALLGGNQAAIESLDDPVRSVEDLIAAQTSGAEAAPVETTDALEFLKAE